MTPQVLTPRSTLHALKPKGLDTPDVESMISYVCRLAHSHSIAVQHLSDWIMKRFDHAPPQKYPWHTRNFSSASEESERWAVWLSDLTGVADLDRLTLSPWRHVMSAFELVPRSDRWCPCCLTEDRSKRHDPYLRLAWEVAPVSVCHQHKVELASVCPHCQRSNVRNRATVVIPGYCTRCGGFLGDAETAPATPEALWIARQIGEALQHRPRVTADGIADLLRLVVERMADNRANTFAKRYGFAKSTVWHWLNEAGIPSVRAWLTIALHGGISLSKLWAGAVEGWVVPHEQPQLTLQLPASSHAGIQSRELDWDEIHRSLRALLDLPVPISINEACKRVGLERGQVYLRANTEARAIAERHRKYRAASKQQKAMLLEARVHALLEERLAAGYTGISARDVWEQLDDESRSVEGVFSMITNSQIFKIDAIQSKA